jgi:hypothetical protein
MKSAGTNRFTSHQIADLVKDFEGNRSISTTYAVMRAKELFEVFEVFETESGKMGRYYQFGERSTLETVLKPFGQDLGSFLSKNRLGGIYNKLIINDFTKTNLYSIKSISLCVDRAKQISTLN